MAAPAHVVWGKVEDNGSSSSQSQVSGKSGVIFQKIPSSSSDRTSQEGLRVPKPELRDNVSARQMQERAINLAEQFLTDADEFYAVSRAEHVPGPGPSSAGAGPAGPAAISAASALSAASVAASVAASALDPGDPQRGALLGSLLEVALGPRDGLWSRGSAQHISGNCKACHYIHTSRGCANGQDCKFCHIPHTGMDRSKVCMSKRLHCNRIADALAAQFGEDPVTFRELSGVVGHRSSYLQGILDAKMNGDGQTDSHAPPGQHAGAFDLRGIYQQPEMQPDMQNYAHTGHPPFHGFEAARQPPFNGFEAARQPPFNGFEAAGCGLAYSGFHPAGPPQQPQQPCRWPGAGLPSSSSCPAQGAPPPGHGRALPRKGVLSL